jgi:GxxExxY protein
MKDQETRDFPHKELTERIIGAAIAVHRVVGPGLLESAYEFCLAEEFVQAGLSFERQVPLPVVYRGKKLDCGYRMDFVVEGKVVVEIKCVDKLTPIHEAQLMTSLKLSGLEVGLLINFNVLLLRDGIVRRAISNPSLASAFSATSAVN